MIKSAFTTIRLLLLILALSMARNGFSAQADQTPAEQPAPTAPPPATPPAGTPPPAPSGTVQVVAAPPVNDTQAAVEESVRRQAALLELRKKLDLARQAEARKDNPAAAKLYSDSWNLATFIGPERIPQEAQAAKTGLINTHMAAAVDAQHRGELYEADTHIKQILAADPGNRAALDFKAENDKLIAEQFPRHPTQDAVVKAHTITLEKATNNTYVHDGVLFFELGKLDEAEAKFNLALAQDPANDAARYYLNLVQDARFKNAQADHELNSRRALSKVEEEWITKDNRNQLPIPNPYTRIQLQGSPTGQRGRSAIQAKLDRIRLDTFPPSGADNLPLSEIVKVLTDEAKKRDPEKKGINFIVNPSTDIGGFAASSGLPIGGGAGNPNFAPAPAPLPQQQQQIDPATGLPLPAAAPEQIDVNAIQIKLSPPLTDIRLADALDAITKVAERHIRYSIEDYAVVFSLKGAENPQLFMRIINIDPNTFVQGLQSVIGLSVGGFQGTGGGGGGGGGAGGANGQQNTTIPRVEVTSGTVGGAGGGGGAGGAGGQGAGIVNVTRTNLQLQVQTEARNFFLAAGVDLAPPKSIFFNDRKGLLVVYATLADIDKIETAIQALNATAPQVNIAVKFVEVTQNDNKQLGFEYFLGNTLMNNGAMGLQGGTAPSFNGRPSAANPEGTFPGSATLPSPTAPTALPVSSTDQLLTKGLRNQLGVQNPVNTPTLATFTGILTDPQFRVVLHAIEQRDGVDLLTEANLLTVSGRQAQIQTGDVLTIVSGSGAGGAGGGIGGR